MNRTAFHALLWILVKKGNSNDHIVAPGLRNALLRSETKNVEVAVAVDGLGFSFWLSIFWVVSI